LLVYINALDRSQNVVVLHPSFGMQIVMIGV
jgi:hypothetical protein